MPRYSKVFYKLRENIRHQIRAVRPELSCGPTLSLIVGVSGGSDSVALLHLLDSLAEEESLSLTVCHVNHQTRPECAKEEEFVKELSSKLALALHVANLDSAPERVNFEHWAREARYCFFEEARVAQSADVIVTAHHRDDAIETNLFRMFSGRMSHHVGGMKVLDKGSKLFRPLLTTSKKDISLFLETENISAMEDSSNHDLRYTRNAIRHKILPELRETFGEEFSQTFGSYLERISEDERGLEIIAREIASGGVEAARLRQVPAAVRWRVLRYLFAESFPEQPCPSYAALRDLSEQLGRAIQRPFDFVNVTQTVVLQMDSTGQICFRNSLADADREVAPKGRSIKLPFNGDIEWPVEFARKSILRARTLASKRNLLSDMKYLLDFDRVSNHNCWIRSRLPGDRIQVSEGQVRTVKKLLKNAGIPTTLKPHVPIVMVNDEPALIPGVGIAEKFRANASSKRLLTVEWEVT